MNFGISNWDVIVVFGWKSGFGLYVLWIFIKSLIINNNDKYSILNVYIYILLHVRVCVYIYIHGC